MIIMEWTRAGSSSQGGTTVATTGFFQTLESTCFSLPNRLVPTSLFEEDDAICTSNFLNAVAQLTSRALCGAEALIEEPLKRERKLLNRRVGLSLRV